MSISKRSPPLFEARTMRPATEAEMSRYLDFFMDTDFVRCRNPVDTAILDFLEIGHPDAGNVEPSRMTWKQYGGG